MDLKGPPSVLGGRRYYTWRSKDIRVINSERAVEGNRRLSDSVKWGALTGSVSHIIREVEVMNVHVSIFPRRF